MDQAASADMGMEATNDLARGDIPAALASDRYAISFRRRFHALTIILLIVNLAIGLFARHQQHAVINHAINTYDTAFVSTNYVNLAQIAFQHYVDERTRAASEAETAKANELLDDVLDNMDVAIERASSAAIRTAGRDVRDRLAELHDVAVGDPSLEDRIIALRQKMERLRQRNSDVGLKARDDIEDLSLKADLFLFASIFTSIILAGLVLLVMQRMISSMKRRSNDHLQAALEGMPQGLSLVDDRLRLIVCNAQYAEMYNLPAELTQPGTSLGAILDYRAKHGSATVGSEDFVSEKLSQAAQPTTLTFEQQLQDGRIISLIKAPLNTGGSIAIHMDVTEKRASEKKIAFLAHHDALTALANRVQLREHIEKTLGNVERGGKAAILCLDLDNFKAVNDTLGHSIGDALLCAVAERLQEVLRAGDLVSRTGGDEFAIVQSADELSAETVGGLASRIVETLSAPFDISDHTVVIGVSVGIAMAPDDGGDADQLLKNADMALYRAKGEGRGRFHFFEPEMDVKAQSRRLLELDLRKAIGSGEFELFYQPIVNLAEDRITGFEALLRWNHPTRGRVPPGEFIPVAEETGLITSIGMWVIRQACIEAKTWPSDLRVAVNVSPVQFRAKGLASMVTSAVANSGLLPSRLELEITETVLMFNNEETLATLHQLQALGVRISMDDFGTGYSSLSYLRSFPFDKIKIDQSFVRDLIDNPDSIGIIRAIAGLGKSMGVTTTAEGVETQEQLDQMRIEGCTEVQGYFYSRPVPASEIGSVLSGFRDRAQTAA
ncbi:bifunctional diguanylate cyclase/phosphodiesterase [Bradyrhizobium sp. CCBAU 53340]|uniref:putative bifunctional diguanylate cyclase/phosphodiesterase n=1 Tax=Bradyrhizobium sp. CCBAU 53340 TaxID=1325112 RepID=UPI00188A5466|nr:EAL domain-containing protein [Bradyrhizobium sp. CCBAU 53340]